MKKRLRKLGDIMLDMEELLIELADNKNHDLQHGEILNLIRGYLEIHYPEQKEEYMDGTNPIFYYGPGEKK